MTLPGGLDCTATCSVCGPIEQGRRKTLDHAVEAHAKGHDPSDRTVGPTKITTTCTPKD